MHAGTPCRSLLCRAGWVALLAGTATAQRLPVRRISTADGLPSARVNTLLQDGKGFLWVGTWDGLARYDGRRVVAYGRVHGLPIGAVTALARDRAGRLWVGTHGGGVALFADQAPSDPDGDAPLFTTIPVDVPREANVVTALLAGDRALWCCTEGGIYRAALEGTGVPRFDLLWRDPTRRARPLAFLAPDGEPRFVVREGVVQAIAQRLEPIAPLGGDDGAPMAIAARAGTAWLAYERGLWRFDAASGSLVRVPLELRAREHLYAVAAGDEGVLWVGTTHGLLRIAGAEQRRIGAAQGLPDPFVRAVLVDADGALWAGTHQAGACWIADESTVTFAAGGRGMPANVVGVLEGSDGTIVATSEGGGVQCAGEGGLVPVPGGDADPFRNVGIRIHQDRSGAWWVGGDGGLWRFAGPAPVLRDGVRVALAEGAPGTSVHGAIHEDPDGSLWFGTGDGGFWRIDPEAVRAVPPVARRMPWDGPAEHPARKLVRGPEGALWIAPFVGLWRMRGEHPEAVRPLGLADPHVNVRALHFDRQGRLWLALRFHGVAVTDEPQAEQPRFRGYSMREGLASDTVWDITERNGRLYFATARGLDELDPETGAVRHWTSADGLAGDLLNAVTCDRRGRLWVAASGGLTCLDPDRPRAARPPPVFLAAITVNGRGLPLPPTGVAHVDRLELPPEPDLRLSFTGVAFRPLRFEFRLSAGAPWSAPSEQLAVHYPRLMPGSYRFEVRAVDRDGLRSAQPAVVELRVLAPIWQRWWFVALLAAAVAAAGAVLHRARVRRLLAVERLRTQIATDLHDDVGAGLSQIAIVAELGKRAAGHGEAAGAFTDIAGIARSLRDGIADIVWAVDPRRDRLVDLVRRARHFTTQMLERDGVTLRFVSAAEAELERIALPAAARRHLWLWLKEAVRNVAAHADATRVLVAIEVRDGELRLAVEDDGKGFDPDVPVAGCGLRNLRRRAAELGGRSVLDTTPGAGTRLALTVVLREVAR